MCEKTPHKLDTCLSIATKAIFYNLLINYSFLGGASDKKSACQCRRHQSRRFDPWVRKIPWSRQWQPVPVFLPGKFYGQGSLAGYRPWGHRVRRNWAHIHINVMYYSDINNDIQRKEETKSNHIFCFGRVNNTQVAHLKSILMYVLG